MSDLEQWDVAAGGNIENPPNGFPENMDKSDVNDASREVMAAVRRWYDDPQWVFPFYEVNIHRIAVDQFQLDGDDYTVYFAIGRRVRTYNDVTYEEGNVTAATYSAGNTLVTVDNDSLQADLDRVEIHAVALKEGAYRTTGTGSGEVPDNDDLGALAYKTLVDVGDFEPDAIEAADIAANAVTNAKIEDDAINLAKMDTGDEGQLISYDASANPTQTSGGSGGYGLHKSASGVPVWAQRTGEFFVHVLTRDPPETSDSCYVAGEPDGFDGAAVDMDAGVDNPTVRLTFVIPGDFDTLIDISLLIHPLGTSCEIYERGSYGGIGEDEDEHDYYNAGHQYTGLTANKNQELDLNWNGDFDLLSAGDIVGLNLLTASDSNYWLYGLRFRYVRT